MKLPPIDGKKKKDGNRNKNDYPEHVVIMDAEDINKAIEGNTKLDSWISVLSTIGHFQQFVTWSPFRKHNDSAGCKK